MYCIAVLGARGLVGKTLIRLLHETSFPCRKLYALGRSEGVMPHPAQKSIFLEVEALDQFDFSKIDILFSAIDAPSMIALRPRLTFIPLVIDKSSAFRLDASFPLLVPEINQHLIISRSHSTLPLWLCSPNCIAIPLSLGLHAVDTFLGVNSYILSTYQSVSGAGQEALENFLQGTSNIIDTVMPCIGPLNAEGISDEEEKIEAEINKLMQRPIPAAITSVRVPVTVSHGLSLAINVKRTCHLNELDSFIAPFLSLSLAPEDLYKAKGSHQVMSSRWRWSTSGHLLTWISCDNLLKGAALNALQCAEIWHKHSGASRVGFNI